MSAKNPFLDTNVLVYAHTGQDDRRALTAQRLIEAGAVIGVQQLNEFASVAHRKLGRPWNEIRRALEDLRILCPNPVPVTLQIHEMALEIAERFGYRIYDSLVVAAALEAGCDVLYSEDMQDGQQIRTLTIRNPFVDPS
jgi:predicted nucleic acid-binding protein